MPALMKTGGLPMCARYAHARAFAMLIGALSCVAWYPGVAHAAAGVGTVTYASGSVFVQPTNGAKHEVRQGATLENGDTVETGPGAEAVLTTTDRQKIYLKSGTLYRVDDYHFSADKPDESHSVTTLLKGGLRIISGLIGHQGNPNAYQLKTQMATIGIRGTEYSVIDDAPGHRGESIVVVAGAIDVNTGSYHDEIRAGSGTILHQQQMWFVRLPANQVPSVVPSQAAAPACQ
jgi:hypothetical protein